MADKQNPFRHTIALLNSMAGLFTMASSRSGGMMMSTGLIPQLHGPSWYGPATIHGRRKHAGEVREARKRKRRRAHLRSMGAR